MTQKGNIYLNTKTGEIFILRQEIYNNVRRKVYQSVTRDTYFETESNENLILIGNIYNVVYSVLEEEKSRSR